MTIYCPKCGNLYKLFYNAGMPVWGCRRCRDKQILVWSDRTILADEQMEVTAWDAQEQRDYEAAVEMAEHCERYEPTYNADDGSM